MKTIKTCFNPLYLCACVLLLISACATDVENTKPEEEKPIVLNVCGGEGLIEEEPGASCGTCGKWECEGKELIICANDNVNECGACEELTQRVGDECGTCGKWTCEGKSLSCVGDEINACGGCSTLANQPGDKCGDCGAYICDGRENVICVDAANACKGCGILKGVPGESCGTCNKGVWTCDENKEDVSCIGDLSPNVCEGCTPLEGVLGEACGDCNDGVLACEGKEKIVCSGAREKNECGGCLVGKMGDTCGACLDGIYDRCRDNELFCQAQDANNTLQKATRFVGPSGGSYLDSDDTIYSTTGSLRDDKDKRFYKAHVEDVWTGLLNPTAQILKATPEHKLCIYFIEDSNTNGEKRDYNCTAKPQNAYSLVNLPNPAGLGKIYGCCTTGRDWNERFLKLGGFSGNFGKNNMTVYYEVSSFEPHTKTCSDLNFKMSFGF